MRQHTLLLLGLLCGFMLLISEHVPKSMAFQYEDDDEEDDDEFAGSSMPAPAPSKPSTPSSASGSTQGERSEPSPASSGKQSAFSVVVEHALCGTNDCWKKRNVLSTSKDYVDVVNGPLMALKSPLMYLTKDEQAEFKQLAEKNGFYRIRIPVKSDNPDSGYVTSSVKAKTLLDCMYGEEITLHFDANDQLINFNYEVPTDRKKCGGIARGDKQNFKTQFSIVYGEQIQVVKIAEPEPKFTVDADGKPVEQQPQEQQSFLRKYWMYIIPAVLLMMMGGGPEPPAGGQGGRPAAGGGGGGARR
eukprot:GFYU01006980.1.p1 GENE.GFYU01006980.1~~GFYU01006980.1.p1  ORF type:complete len:302 (-),score=97.94 GFYU01006980.1:15-920(-)